MKKTLIALSLMVGVIGQAHAKERFSREVLNPSLWYKQEPASAVSECSGGTRQCALQMLEQAGENVDNARVQVFRLGEQKNGTNLTIALVDTKVDGDDSIARMRYRLAMQLDDVEDRSYKLVNMGTQFKCHRGKQRNWSKAFCP
jgi:hypothetical protein